jgi:hypothetical protein
MLNFAKLAGLKVDPRWTKILDSRRICSVFAFKFKPIVEGLYLQGRRDFDF